MVFDRFQQYVEVIRKSNEKCYKFFNGQFNDLKTTGKV